MDPEKEKTYVAPRKNFLLDLNSVGRGWFSPCQSRSSRLWTNNITFQQIHGFDKGNSRRCEYTVNDRTKFYFIKASKLLQQLESIQLSNHQVVEIPITQLQLLQHSQPQLSWHTFAFWHAGIFITGSAVSLWPFTSQISTDAASIGPLLFSLRHPSLSSLSSHLSLKLKDVHRERWDIIRWSRPNSDWHGHLQSALRDGRWGRSRIQ